MKRLFIMRHARAEDQFSGSDLSRPLTQKGREIQDAMAKFLKEQAYAIEGILYSPYKRAEESAQILSQHFPQALLFKEPALGTIFDSYTILRHLEEKPFENLLLVGHAPTLSIFGQSLLKEPQLLAFDKSTVALLEFKAHFEFGQGKLVCVFNPGDVV